MDHARQSRDAFSSSMQETEGHRQMWEMSHSGQLGSNLQLQDHFIKDFLLPKLEYNYEKFQGVMGDPHRLRPYIEEYTAQNYDRMLSEMAGQVQGADAVRARHQTDRAEMPGSQAVATAGARYLAQVKGGARQSGVAPQGGPSDQARETAMREFSRNSVEVRDRREGAGQTHRENSTPSNFQKLKPSSIVGKGAEVVENVGEATGRITDGLKGETPVQYLVDTVAGKKKS